MTTRQPVRVWADGEARPALTVPVAQLDEVRLLFDHHGLGYEVEDQVISFNGGPEEAFINFTRETDPAAVQAILDSVP